MLQLKKDRIVRCVCLEFEDELMEKRVWCENWKHRFKEYE